MNRRDRLIQLATSIVRLNAAPNELIVGGLGRAEIVGLRQAMGDYAEGAAGFARFNHLLAVAVQNGFAVVYRAETVSGTVFEYYGLTDAGIELVPVDVLCS